MSDFPIRREGIRHLEIHTTVAESYCHRTFRVPGQQVLLREIRARGRVGWDWPFTRLWRFPNLRTLRLELRDVHLLPRQTPPTTPHFKPDPMTTEGKNALLTQAEVVRVIIPSFKVPELRELTVLGISHITYHVLLELAILNHIHIDVLEFIERNEEVVQYLSNRTGGRWESQTARSKAYCDLLTAGAIEEVFQLASTGALTASPPDAGRCQLALMMFMDLRAAKHGANDPPTRKPLSILWTW